MLSQIAEMLTSEEDLQQRKEDLAEQDEVLYENFKVWQEVAASQELRCHDTLMVPFGGKGVIIGKSDTENEERMMVKFDERLDGLELCINVLPAELLPQLPAAFGVSIGQRVVAIQDLEVQGTVVIRLATRGTVLSAFEEDRITVDFDELVTPSVLPNSRLNVQPGEVQPFCKLAGGFEVGSKVKATGELKAGDRLMVKAGVKGIVTSSFSSSRINVKFEELEPGTVGLVNVLPAEVEACPAEE